MVKCGRELATRWEGNTKIKKKSDKLPNEWRISKIIMMIICSPGGEGRGREKSYFQFLRNKGVCRHRKARWQCTSICFEVLLSKVGYLLRLLAFDRVLLKIMRPKPEKVDLNNRFKITKTDRPGFEFYNLWMSMKRKKSGYDLFTQSVLFIFLFGINKAVSVFVFSGLKLGLIFNFLSSK